MKCPHCGIACHESWDYKQISPEEEPIGEIKGSLGEFRGVSGSFGDMLRVSGTGYETPKLAQRWLPCLPLPSEPDHGSNRLKSTTMVCTLKKTHEQTHQHRSAGQDAGDSGSRCH